MLARAGARVFGLLGLLGSLAGLAACEQEGPKTVVEKQQFHCKAALSWMAADMGPVTVHKIRSWEAQGGRTVAIDYNMLIKEENIPGLKEGVQLRDIFTCRYPLAAGAGVPGAVGKNPFWATHMTMRGNVLSDRQVDYLNRRIGLLGESGALKRN